MRYFISSDLHLEDKNALNTLSFIKTAIKGSSPDVIIIAGDIAPLASANSILPLLKSATEPAKLIICLGNHDYWIKDPLKRLLIDSYRDLLAEWIEVCRRHQIHLLDESNAEFGDLAVVGGYGHYDLSFRPRNLAINGIPAVLSDYEHGGLGECVWRDFEYIPNARNTLQACAKWEAEQFEKRMQRAVDSNKTVIAITHTAPFAQMLPPRETNPFKKFCRAYGGNSHIGKILSKHSETIALAVCGHTHQQRELQTIRGVNCVNVGSCPEALSALVYDIDDKTRKLTRISV